MDQECKERDKTKLLVYYGLANAMGSHYNLDNHLDIIHSCYTQYIIE